ncbi:MAG: glutamate synthase subunit beta [Nitrospiria bacterium]
MGDPKGFLKIHREGPKRRPVPERVRDFHEFYEDLSDEKLKLQASRCMDCGVPFCQSDTGCPVHNLIPDWNDLIFQERWKDALNRLHLTNNFPEFTGRLCPAPCESACVLGIIDQPVSIRNIEQAIVDRGFKEGWVTPILPKIKLKSKIAIVGSGPAGLAAAQQLCREGFQVSVFEKADRIGGLLRYGIPDFKMEKKILDMRLNQMQSEGVDFNVNVEIGKNIKISELRKTYDAVCLAIGAMKPRDLPVPGRNLDGIWFAMDYLTQSNRVIAGDKFGSNEIISAKGKRVIVIGGGDTGSDCVGTATRQGAKSVQQFEILSRPPESRPPSAPWPYWPMTLRSSHAHEEGCDRKWDMMTKSFTGENGVLKKLKFINVELKKENNGQSHFAEIIGSEQEMEVDLVLIAMGFAHPVHEGLVRDLNLKLDSKGNIEVDEFSMTSVPGVFAAGDSVRGASLIVWAIAEGRKAAEGIERYIKTKTS